MPDTDKNVPPPYGPTEGMLQGIELMHRLSPTRVDAKFLKTNGIAPGNEYKVVGALKYLNIIDEFGAPTTKSRLLKTRGPSYLLALQDIVRTAYGDVFASIDLKTATRDIIHNHFITQQGLGIEMAAKASRFFISLCQLAEITINPDLISGRDTASAGKSKEPKAPKKASPNRKRETLPESPLFGPSPTFVLAITPETAAMGLDDLTSLFKKIRTAMIRADMMKE